MPSFNLYAGEDTLVPVSSGLGFYGDNGFDDPVSIGSYNGYTFTTNGSGTVQGYECNNNKYDTASTVIHGQSGSGISMSNLPNELATINPRFTHPEAIRCQNAKVWIFDGSFTGSVANKATPAENLTFYLAEIRHPSRLQTIESSHSDATWTDVSSSGTNYIGLVDSPGLSGVRQGGGEQTSTRHDWYIALTCSPTQLGDKQFGITFEVEYL